MASNETLKRKRKSLERNGYEVVEMARFWSEHYAGHPGRCLSEVRNGLKVTKCFLCRVASVEHVENVP